MEFKEQLPVWKAEGVAPPETKQNEGWKIGDKPPADWFNYMWSRTYYSLDEIREKIKLINKDVAAAGKVDTVNSVKPDSKKNIELTGSNIKYKTGASENIGVKIDILKKEVDTVKQSGVEINKRISDKLNSMKIEASDTDSISENVTKIEDIPNHGELTKTITTQGGKQIITPGYYEGGEVKAQFNNLTPSNIRSGVNIGGIAGDYIPDTSYNHFSYTVPSGSSSYTFDKTYTASGIVVWVMLELSEYYFKLWTRDNSSSGNLRLIWSKNYSGYGSASISGDASLLSQNRVWVDGFNSVGNRECKVRIGYIK